MELLSETLPSGLTLTGAACPGSPIAGLRLRLAVGSAAETPPEHGLAHLLEHLVVRCLMEGGRIRGGAVVEAATGREQTMYEVVVRAGDVVRAAEVLGAAFQRLRPDHRTLESELAAIARETAERTAQAGWRLQESLFAALWDGTAYAHAILGDRTALEALDPAAVSRFHARWYRPSNAVLELTSGSLEADFAAVASLAAGWPGEPVTEGFPDDGRPMPERIAVARVDSGDRPLLGAALSTGLGPEAARVLAARAVRTLSGLDLRYARHRRHAVTWLTTHDADPGSIGAMLRTAGGHPGLRRALDEALIVELRESGGVETATARLDPAWQAELHSVRSVDIAEVIRGWSLRLAS